MEKKVPNHQSVHVIGLHGLYANYKPRLPKGVKIQEVICSPVTPLFLPAIVAGYPPKKQIKTYCFDSIVFLGGALSMMRFFGKKWYGLVWYTIYTYLFERFKKKRGSSYNGFTNATIENHIQQIQIYHKLRISYGGRTLCLSTNH